jgi:multidrug transporter EmrE-like cation transporter
MGQMTVAAILNFFNAAIFEIAPAIFAQKIERTITEKAIIIIAIRYCVAREILAFKIAEIPVTILHTEYP